MSGALARASARPALRFGPLFSRLLLAGVISGALSGVYAVLITERAMVPALAIEESRSRVGPDAEGPGGELFTRGTQTFGGLVGAVVAAVVFAVLLATAYAAVRHRLPGRTDFSRVALMATVGFAVFALLPALKIPANPPAVGDPTTVSMRTGIYAAVLLAGVVAVMLIAALVSFLRGRGAGAAATSMAAAAATVVLVGAILTLLPGSPDAVPADVPAAVIWDFRIASLGQLFVLWAALGLVGGWLVDRLASSSVG